MIVVERNANYHAWIGVRQGEANENIQDQENRMSCLASPLQLLPNSIIVDFLGLSEYWRGLAIVELVHRMGI